MKLIGKQIVVELPEKYNTEEPYVWKRVGFNQALTEVARMNPALEIVWPCEEIKRILYSQYAITGGGTYSALERDVEKIINACQAAVERAKEQ